jgi:multiple sugar transport system substrate-binding protein
MHTRAECGEGTPHEREDDMRIIRIFTILGLATVAVQPVLAQSNINFIGTETPATWEAAIERFEALNSDIRVTYQQIPFSSFNAQIEARVGSQDPTVDVYMADTPRVPALASKGYLTDMSALAGEIEAVATPTEQTAVSYQGTFYALPMWTGTQLVYFNRKMFEAAGVEPLSDDPADRLTWEDLLEIAGKVQDAGADYGFSFHQVDRYFQLQPLFESRDVGSGLTGEDLMTPAITSQGWIETANWYQDLFESGLAPRGVAPEQMPDMFINGQVGIIYGGLPLLRRFGQAEGLDFGIAPVPYFAGGRAVTSTGSWAVGVSPYSGNRDAALTFARFMALDGEGAKLANQATSAVPVNSDVYAEYLPRLAALSEGHGDAGAILSYEIENTAVPRPRSRGYVIFEEIMNGAFADIRNGADVAGALGAAEARLRSALSRL